MKPLSSILLDLWRWHRGRSLHPCIASTSEVTTMCSVKMSYCEQILNCYLFQIHWSKWSKICEWDNANSDDITESIQCSFKLRRVERTASVGVENHERLLLNTPYNDTYTTHTNNWHSRNIGDVYDEQNQANVSSTLCHMLHDLITCSQNETMTQKNCPFLWIWSQQPKYVHLSIVY